MFRLKKLLQELKDAHRDIPRRAISGPRDIAVHMHRILEDEKKNANALK